MARFQEVTVSWQNVHGIDNAAKVRKEWHKNAVRGSGYEVRGTVLWCSANLFRLPDRILIFAAMKNYQFTAHIERDHETGFYVGSVPGLPGAHSQAESLDVLYQNLEEVVQLCIEELSEEELKNLQNAFVGTQEIRVAV